ncbi:MAG: excinuclease ABC subunit UvrC [Bacteroidales bacterium]
MLQNESLKEQISLLPEQPGIYQFLNKTGVIIYIGKAINIKKRVSSYFNKDLQSAKTTVLVGKIHTIQYIITQSEEDALLLENSLIKKYQPRYNVLLKDDKTYPWICIKNESFPRVFYTRNVVKDNSEYFGPYASVKMVKTLLEFLRQLYPLRTCNLNLSQASLQKQKYKVCLEFHIGRCKAPCINAIDETSYLENIARIRNILKGNIHSVLQTMKTEMKNFAEALKFEDAQFLKEKIELLEGYQSKSMVVNSNIHNVDVYSIIEDQDEALVNFMKIMNGAVVQSHTIELRKKLNESKEELLGLAIVEIRQKIFSDAREIVVPVLPDFTLNNVEFHIPQRGEKKSLLELSERNLYYYRAERMKQLQKTDPDRHTNRILNSMKDDLQLPELPVHIECFDNSNLQGTNPVAACVVFRNAKPSKKDYRHFNIKTVQGPDDFASMKEVITRRYTRLIQENEPLPQLIIVDGGKGQLSSAVEVLKELGIFEQVSIIGIAKRLEEIFKPNDSIPLYLSKKSDTLKLIQQLRDEAHRFGVTHHRQKRSTAFIHSELDAIKGIGETLKSKLYSELKTIEAIKTADLETLQKIIGAAKAELVYKFFHSQ